MEVDFNVASDGAVAEKAEEILPEHGTLREKRSKINQACLANDVRQLVDLATSDGGLIDDGLRQQAWPVLLGYQSGRETAPDSEPDPSWKALPPHRDEEQVELDVNRAFVYYPNNESEAETKARKALLSNLIVSVLRSHPQLCYFQGFHDIVQVLLLVLGESAAQPAVARISLFRIRDYMLPSLSPALKHLQLLPPILEQADPALARRLSHTRPFFALSATITMYAHDIQVYSDIARLFDFVLAHEPVVAIYLFAAIVISRRKELLDIPLDEPDMLHFTLSKLPQPLDLEALVSKALLLFDRFPPHRLPHFVWWKLSSYSVLRTSRSLTCQGTLQEGEALLRKQTQQLKREEMQQRMLLKVAQHKKPLFRLSMALLFGGLSVWLRSTGNDRILWMLLLRTARVQR